MLEFDLQIERVLSVVAKRNWFQDLKEHVGSGNKPPGRGPRVLGVPEIGIRALIDFVLLWCRNRSLCKRYCFDGRSCTWEYPTGARVSSCVGKW